MAVFKSFWPTVVRWFPSHWNSNLKLIADAETGAPIGVQSQNANGPDGIWAPVPLSAAQIAAPAPAMLADLNATYQLNVAPYTRYQSDGTQLVALGGGNADGSSFPGTILQTVPPGTPELDIGPNSYAVVYSPFTVQNDAGVRVMGRLDVVTRPA